MTTVKNEVAGAATQKEKSTVVSNLFKIGGKLSKVAKEIVEKVKKAVKATKKLNRSVRTTFFVTDYKKFKLLHGFNRDVKLNPRLLADLKQFGQLDPIHVRKDEDGNWIVLNGQHRLFYLMYLGYPIECIEVFPDENRNDFDIIKSLNVKGSGWVKGNYIAHYRTEGNLNYIEFERLRNKLTSLSETLIYLFINGKKGKLKEHYENGDLEFSVTPEQEEQLTILNDLMRLLVASRKTNAVITRLDKLKAFKLFNDFTSQKNYDLDTFKKVIETEGYNIHNGSTLEDLTSIYTNTKIKEAAA